MIPFKKYLPRTLFVRSLLILTVPIVLTMTISTYIFFDRHWDNMARKLAFATAAEIGFLVDEIDKITDYHDSNLKALENQALRNMHLNLQFMAGEKIAMPIAEKYTVRSHIIQKYLSEELDKNLRYPYKIIVDSNEKWTQTQVQLQQGVLVITIPMRRLFSSSGYVFLLWMIGSSMILLSVAVLFMRNQIRPIKRLAIAAERFGKGRDVPFFKPEGAKEVRAAALSFIDMRNRINRQIQQRTAMLAGVSHDLRTPLTRMKLQAEMMPDSPDVKALKSDIADMERMINAYLQFAKGDGNESMQRSDMILLLQKQKEMLQRNGSDVTLTYDPKDSYEIFMRPIAMERCIGNILTNSQKYAKTIWATLARTEENIILTIDDDGPGVNPQHYEDVFKPFFREEKSRNSKTGGVGLGLPIAQDIILAHGGDITLDKSPKGGLRVIITLPL